MVEGTALARLRPESLAHVEAKNDEPLWQQRKSLATRNATLEAALQCLAESGYASCSLQVVARRAGISRGAMLHHYASKLDLMGAVVEYAFYRRMAKFLDRIRELTEEERAVRNAGIAVSFEISQTAEYRAYLELHVASRTDADLRAIFLERASLYQSVWRAEIEKVFPEWAGNSQLTLLDDFVWVMVDGLALNVEIWADSARVDAILNLVAKTITAIRDGNLKI